MVIRIESTTRALGSRRPQVLAYGVRRDARAQTPARWAWCGGLSSACDLWVQTVFNVAVACADEDRDAIVNAMSSFELGQSEHDQLHRRYAKGTSVVRALRLLANKPRLVPHAALTALQGATNALRADPTLGWLGSVVHVRQVQPQAILGAEWGGMTSFMGVVQRVARPSDVALEIGCGGGRVTRTVRPLVGRLDAVDVSDAILDEARLGVRDTDPVNFFAVDGLGENLPRQEYELVISHDVFVHFEFDEVARYAFNIAGALKPGGAFVVSVYTLDHPQEIASWRSELVESPRLGARRARRMPAETYVAIWAAAGFEVESATRSDVGEYAGKKAYGHLNYVLRRSQQRTTGSPQELERLT